MASVSSHSTPAKASLWKSSPNPQPKPQSPYLAQLPSWGELCSTLSSRSTGRWRSLCLKPWACSLMQQTKEASGSHTSCCLLSSEGTHLPPMHSPEWPQFRRSHCYLCASWDTALSSAPPPVYLPQSQLRHSPKDLD